MLRSVCVFCGSNVGANAEFAEAARILGTTLATRGKRLIYGGGSVGLMGVLADAALEAGGEVIGVLPAALFRSEVAHAGLTTLHRVDSMHERKALMTELADAFIALPGGFGTFDELFEATTWAQLGIHRKPIGVLDVADYFAPLRALIAHAVSQGFVHPEHAALLAFETSAPVLLERLAALSTPG
jgi:uncharacterized protein (TIGR00730 family)